MERMKCMKDKLIEVAYEEINHNLKNLNTCELGEVIDMVKDLSEAIYYCEVAKAMQHSTVPETKKRWRNMQCHILRHQYHIYNGEVIKTSLFFIFTKLLLV